MRRPFDDFCTVVPLCALLAIVPGCGDDDPVPGDDAGAGGSSSGGESSTGGSATGGRSSTGGRPGSTGSCDANITVDGDTFQAVKCTASASGLVNSTYQIVVSLAFNTIASGPVRSVLFSLTDESSGDHVKTYPVGLDVPSSNATYDSPTAVGDFWSTTDGPNNIVGSGNVDLTVFDATAGVSGTYDVVVKKGSEEKTVTGSFSGVPVMISR
jgi:hypothetical protein